MKLEVFIHGDTEDYFFINGEKSMILDIGTIKRLNVLRGP